MLNREQSTKLGVAAFYDLIGLRFYAAACHWIVRARHEDISATHEGLEYNDVCHSRGMKLFHRLMQT